MVPVQVCQANRCNEDRQEPAGNHNPDLEEHHDQAAGHENIATQEKAHNALVNKARVGVQKGADDCHQKLDEIQAVGAPFPCGVYQSENDPKHQVAHVVESVEAAKGHGNHFIHESPVVVVLMSPGWAGAAASQVHFAEIWRGNSKLGGSAKQTKTLSRNHIAPTVAG